MSVIKKKPTIIRFLKYLAPVKFKLFFAIICGVYKFHVGVALAWCIGKVIEIFTLSGLTQEARFDLLLKYFFIMLGVSLFSPIPVYLRHILAGKAVNVVISNLRLDLFAHIQRLSHSFHSNHHSSSLASRVISDVQLCQQFVMQVMIQGPMFASVILFVSVYFFIVDVRLAILSLALIPIRLVLLNTIGKKVKTNSKIIQKKLSILSGTTAESFSNINVVKTFTNEEREKEKFAELHEGVLSMRLKNFKLDSLNQVFNTLLSSLAPLLIIGVGGYYGIFHPETVTISTLITFVLLQGQIYNPISSISELQLVLSEAQGAMERMYELFDTTSDVKNKKKAFKAPLFKGKIEMKNITFSYEKSVNIIEDITLSINPNQTVAFVGASGSGKSTLASLIPRFYNLQNGSIYIDDIDISDLILRTLRSQIGIVPQEPMLFTGTIFDNIIYGHPQAEEEDVYKAAHQAYADEFIKKMPQGYLTVIGENGAKLSGGQKQRLAIARAFLKNPPILILDEATSSLDTESEIIIQKSLEELKKNRTTIIIAHRLSTIENCDKIYVFHEGTLIEQGNHDFLLGQNGKYAQLAGMADNSI